MFPLVRIIFLVWTVENFRIGTTEILKMLGVLGFNSNIFVIFAHSNKIINT